MTIDHALGQEVVVHFEGDVPLRDAIELPEIVRSFPADETVVLDFRSVRHLGALEAAALIPALASLHDRAVRALGLSHLDCDLARLCRPAFA